MHNNKLRNHVLIPDWSSGMLSHIEVVSEAGQEREGKPTGWNWCDPRRNLSSGSEVQVHECSTPNHCRRTLATAGQRGWQGGQGTVLFPQSRVTGWPMDCQPSQTDTLATRWCRLNNRSMQCEGTSTEVSDSAGLDFERRRKSDNMLGIMSIAVIWLRSDICSLWDRICDKMTSLCV